ncbi:hypothetical protein [Formosa haliotis]|uniref:hypothetical protein n=1 Tax=Formosa haliotis TaxID=1555194 RepID=UPI000825E662|nr:hypothetical protein [Formosa haliotis]
MKQPLLLLFTFLFLLIAPLNAQEIEHKGNIYEVKGSSILLDGYDVTESLTIDDQREIRHKYEAREDEFRAIEKQKRKEEKAEEKEERKAIKEEKKAERKANKNKRFLIF